MSENRLNLDALRRNRLPRLRARQGVRNPKVSRFLTPSATWEEVALTRRNLFGVAAYAGLGFSPTVKAVQALLDSAETPFNCTVTETRIAFSLHGRERWVIDTRWFGGRPRLTYQRAPGRILVELSGATFPGTQLPADFVCHIHKATLLWRMDLAFRLGSFHSQVPFVRWLAQKESARSDVRLSDEICALGRDGEARLSGYAAAEFTPDWLLTLRGGRVAEVRGIGGLLESDAVRVALLDPQAPSLVTHAEGPRTLVTLQRATRTWLVEPSRNATDLGSLNCPENVFQTLHLETFEGENGRPGCALLAEGTNDGAQPSFEVGRGLAEWGGEPVHLPLVGARYVKFFHTGGGEGEQAFLAQYADAPVALRLQGCSVHLGNAPGTPPFELSGNGGGMKVCCEPAVHRVHVPIAGAIAEPFEPPPGTRLNLAALAGLDEPQTILTAAPGIEQRVLPNISQGAQQPAQQAPKSPATPAPSLGAAQIQIQPGLVLAPTNFRAVLAFVGPFTVPVIRPEDLLVLKFEFRNLTLSIGPGKPPMVVRGQSGPRPMLIVHVPPQNIGEQAFFETSKDCAKNPIPPQMKSPTGNKELDKQADAQNKRNEPGGGAEDCKFPIRASLAGWSRLAFQLPDNLPGLSFSLTNLKEPTGNEIPGLLDWTRLEPVLARNTAPPPDPPVRILVDPRLQLQPGFMAPAKPQIVPAPQPGMQPFRKPQSLPLPNAPSGFRWQDVRGPSQSIGKVQIWLASDHRYLVQFGPAQSQLKTPQMEVGPLILAPTPPKKEDLPNVTAIEAPYRLFMSPSQMGGWAHSIAPVQQNGRFELWHSRLGVRRVDPQGRPYVDERDAWYRTMRAIWSPDFDDKRPAGPDGWKNYVYPPQASQQPGKWRHFKPDKAGPDQVDKTWNPFRMSLDARDRNELVHLSGDGTLDNANWKKERFAKVERFMLSSLGAWMNLRYAADIPLGTPLTVEEWRHRGTMGRDHYVRVVYAGYLFPFGHRASLVKVTERKFEEVDNKIVACLRQRMFIVVRQPVREYYPNPVIGLGTTPSHGRSFPFKQLRVRTLVTPNLDDPASPRSAIPNAPAQEAFWPHVCQKMFSFNFVGEDQAGRPIELSVPCAFVSRGPAFTPAWLAVNVVDPDGPGPKPPFVPSYLQGPPGRNESDLNAQKIAYAPMQAGMDTVLETVKLIFGAELPVNVNSLDMEKAGQPMFYPTVHQSIVRVPAIQDLIGDGVQIALKYSQFYKDQEWNVPANAGAIFMDLVQPLGLGFSPDKAGGVATPNMEIKSLSARKGPVGGDPKTFAEDKFDPAKFFYKATDPNDPKQVAKEARFLGGIALADIIKPGPASKAPNLVTRRGSEAEAVTQRGVGEFKPPEEDDIRGPLGGETGAGTDIKVTDYHYETEDLTSDPLKLFVPNPSPPVINEKSKLTLDAKIFMHFAVGQAPEPQFNVKGKCTNFEINIFKMIRVRFKGLEFKKDHGKDLDVDPSIDDVKFGGPLEFLNNLADAIGGKGDEKKNAGLVPRMDFRPRLVKTRLFLTAEGGKEECKGELDFKFIKSFSPSKIKAGFMLCLPNLPLGAASLTGLSITVYAELKLLSLLMGAASDLTLDNIKKEFGKAFTVYFAFCTRERPFHLIIYIFGGGGFVGMKLGIDGFQMLEIAIEFGAEAELNFGIASGGAHIFAGIYFKLEKKQIKCASGKNEEVLSVLFEAYVRAGGHLSVLGIITISIELQLKLQYTVEGGNAVLAGEALLTIKVEILFFSVSVSVKVRKEFVGSSAKNPGEATCQLEDDTTNFARLGAHMFRTQGQARPFQAVPNRPIPPPPKIVELVAKPEWDRYAASFAAD